MFRFLVRRPNAGHCNLFEVVGARSFVNQFRNSGRVKPGIWNGSGYDSNATVGDGKIVLGHKVGAVGYVVVKIHHYSNCPEVAGGAELLGGGWVKVPKVPGARFAFATDFVGGQDDAQVGWAVEWTTRGLVSSRLALNEALMVVDGKPILSAA